MGKYRSIAISGLPGAGKNELCRRLGEHYGLEVYSIGTRWRELFEEECKSRKIPFKVRWDEVPVEDNLAMDEKIKGLIGNRSVILDGRYSAFISKGLPFLRVFLSAPPFVRAERNLHRYAEDYPGISQKELIDILLKREISEYKTGMKMYGRDYRDVDLYDISLDTGSLSIEEELDMVGFAFTK